MAIPALLDACVLYPVGLRDTLLNVAEAGYFRVLWSEDILAETSRNIVEDVPDLTAKHLEKTFAAMRQAFPEAAVRGYEHLVDSMPNHPKDRHVLAAAVIGDAEVLVTNNLRHFPSEACEPLGVRVESPDDFLVEMIDLGPELMYRGRSGGAQCCRREPRSDSVRGRGVTSRAVAFAPVGHACPRKAYPDVCADR